MRLDDKAAIRRFLMRNRLASGAVPGHSSEISAPEWLMMVSKRRSLLFGPIWLRPPANTATVRPARGAPISSMAWMAPQWAAASVPKAPPDTMRCPARAACLASSCALCLPYSLTPRDPTTPIGSGHDTNACGLPCPQRHNGAAQSVCMVRSASCEGQQGWCGATIHCVPPAVNQSLSSSESVLGSVVKRCCQETIAPWNEAMPRELMLRPQRVMPLMNAASRVLQAAVATFS